MWKGSLSKFGLIMMIGIIIVANSNVTVQAAEQNKGIVIHQVPLNFVVNGQLYATPAKQEGFIFNNSTYVPLRFAAYTFEQKVIWDGPTGTVTIGLPTDEEKLLIAAYNQTNKLQLSQLSATTAKPLTLNWTVSLRAVQYVFHNEVKSPPADMPGILYDGTLYVPIRFFGESLGVEIDYDQESRTVSAITYDIGSKSLKDQEATGSQSPGKGSTLEGQQSNSTSKSNGNSGNVQGADTALPLDDAGIVDGETPIVDEETPVVDKTLDAGTPPVVTPPVVTPPVVTPPVVTPPVVTPPVVTPLRTSSSIVRATETSITRLKASCTNRMTVVYLKYLNATTLDAKMDAVAGGYSIMGDCDTSFNGIMDSFIHEMSSNGYVYTQAVASYRATYEAEKDAAMSSLIN